MLNGAQTQSQVLVETEWAVANLDNPALRFVEVSQNPQAYASGHIPNAIAWNWKKDTQDTLRRNVPSREDFSALLSQSGISRNSTVVLYGDRSNLLATYAFWLLKYYRHPNVRVLNGGRKKWLTEKRPLSTIPPIIEPTAYDVPEPDRTVRAFRDFVFRRHEQTETVLIDVRSPKEYSGELLAPEHLPQEGAARGGHIPGAVNIQWGRAMQSNGTFKPLDKLRQLYQGFEVLPDQDVIVYCRIGERSSHSWFVLKHLLGYPNVYNYDGSWVEWGNLIDAPIERGCL